MSLLHCLISSTQSTTLRYTHDRFLSGCKEVDNCTSQLATTSQHRLTWILPRNHRNVRIHAHTTPTHTSCTWTCTRAVIFTALHGMQTRSCDEISVRLSVCQTRALWQNGRKLCLDFYIIWKNIYPSFLRRSMVGGGRPLLPEIFGQPAHVGAKSRILNQ